MPKVWRVCSVECRAGVRPGVCGSGQAARPAQVGSWVIVSSPVKKVPVVVRPAATVPASAGSALLAMEARAAVIFAGHVVRVDRRR